MPASCPPSASEQLEKCSCCGHAEWQAPPEAPPELGDCEVFLPSAVVRTHFPVYSCGRAGCAQPQSLSTDGVEYGLLRMTAEVAYGMELLYQWADKTGTGGIPWFTFWRDTVMKYKGCVRLLILLAPRPLSALQTASPLFGNVIIFSPKTLNARHVEFADAIGIPAVQFLAAGRLLVGEERE